MFRYILEIPTRISQVQYFSRQAWEMTSGNLLHIPLACIVTRMTCRSGRNLQTSLHSLWILHNIDCTGQGWLKIWIWQLWPKIETFIPLWILVNGTNIICLPTKNKQFCKIKRLWLKNWACHAHLKFKIQKGVASLFFEPHPPNFGKICILYRWKNDIITFFK